MESSTVDFLADCQASSCPRCPTPLAYPHLPPSGWPPTRRAWSRFHFLLTWAVPGDSLPVQTVTRSCCVGLSPAFSSFPAEGHGGIYRSSSELSCPWEKRALAPEQCSVSLVTEVLPALPPVPERLLALAASPGVEREPGAASPGF